MPSKLRAIFHRRTEASGQEKWHQQIEQFRDLSEYLIDGRHPPDPSWVDTLRQSTTMLVDTTLAEETRDNTLRELVEKHVRRSQATRDIAVLSCLPVFSPRVAFENVLALKDLPEVRYLRVLGIACHLTTKLM